MDLDYKVGDKVTIPGNQEGYITYIVIYTGEARYGVHYFNGTGFASEEFYGYELEDNNTSLGFKK